MAEPIPRAVLRIVEEQLQRLADVAPKHVDAIVALAQRVQNELEARLKSLAPGKFTTQQTRTVLVAVRAIIDALGRERGQLIGDELQRAGEIAARVGRDGLAEQLAEWDSVHPGAGLFRPDVKTASELLDPGLLEYYDVSRETYGTEAVKAMRMTLVKSAIANETIAQTWEKMAADVAIPAWRAERIVRTEQSFAMHRRQILDMIDMFGNDADKLYRKQLVATIDGRTGEDSRFVDGQIRKLDEEFVDDHDRHYQHPPNRPNDREVVVFVPAEIPRTWTGASGSEGFGPDIGSR